jgi:Protein of unknown function (DUF3237)
MLMDASRAFPGFFAIDMSIGTIDDAGWTEHWGLSDKRLVYAFSLDVHYRLIIPDSPAVRLRLTAIRATECSTYHVCADREIRGADGKLHEVPLVRIVSGEDWVNLGGTGAGVLNGALVAQSIAESDERLTIEYRGVAAFPRGFQCLRGAGKPSQVPGTAFISTRHSSTDAKYRWLESQPLFGFGQVLIDPEPAAPIASLLSPAPQPECRLKLSFDLYSGV